MSTLNNLCGSKLNWENVLRRVQYSSCSLTYNGSRYIAGRLNSITTSIICISPTEEVVIRTGDYYNDKLLFDDDVIMPLLVTLSAE